MDSFWFVDWRLLMAAVELWLAGGNPYGPFVIPNSVAVAAGGYAYPPPTQILALPFALLPWLISGLLVQLVAIIGFERWARRTSGRTALPWLLLWLPFAQGLVIGQLTLLALVGLLLAEHAYSDRRDRLAGLLLALAIIKPQTTVLAVAWLLFVALRERRWVLLASFAGVSALLWGGILLISGPEIYLQWVQGLQAYREGRPDRPLLGLPLGPLLGLLAGLLWWRHGRSDGFGTLLLINTLIFPLSVVYIAIGVACVVIRWRPNWAWYPLTLSWLLPVVFIMPVRSADSIAGLVQAIIATALLAGLLPRLPFPLRRRPAAPA